MTGTGISLVSHWSTQFKSYKLEKNCFTKRHHRIYHTPMQGEEPSHKIRLTALNGQDCRKKEARQSTQLVASDGSDAYLNKKE